MLKGENYYKNLLLTEGYNKELLKTYLNFCRVFLSMSISLLRLVSSFINCANLEVTYAEKLWIPFLIAYSSLTFSHSLKK